MTPQYTVLFPEKRWEIMLIQGYHSTDTCILANKLVIQVSKTFSMQMLNGDDQKEATRLITLGLIDVVYVVVVSKLLLKFSKVGIDIVDDIVRLSIMV